MAQPEPPVEVANEFVTVRKSRVETEKEGVLGIELRFTTDADGPVDVRVVEQLPEFVSMEDVGLHPGYQPRNWTIVEDERRLIYEDVVSPDEELVTLYGVLTENYDDVGSFLAEPEIELAEPAGKDGGDADLAGGVFGESLLGESANGEAADASERPADVLASSDGPSVEQPDGSSVDADGATGDPSFVYEGDQPEGSSLLGTDDAAGGPDREDAPAGATPPAEARETASVASGSVVSALLDELEDEAGDDQLAALREALGVETPDSVGVRLSHLQSEVATLSAFAEEFERFVDEEGGLGEVVDDLRGGLRGVEAELDELSSDLRERVDDVDERTKRMRGRVRDVDDLVDDLADDVEATEAQRDDLREAHDADVDRLDGRIEDLETQHDDVLESVRADVEALRDALDAEREWRGTVVESFGDIVDRSVEDAVVGSGVAEDGVEDGEVEDGE